MTKPDASHIAQKNHLWSLIKRVGELWGEDPDFLREYGKGIYITNKSDLKRAIECFEDLLKNAEIIFHGKRQGK